MSSWKVILATFIIFGAGVLTGGLIVRHEIGTQPPKPVVHRPPPPPIITKGFVDRMQSELSLTTDQRDRIDKIVKECQERIDILWKLVRPEMDEEKRNVIEEIRAQLRPDQIERFEQLMKERPRRGFGDGRGRGRGTNDPSFKPSRPPREPH